MMTPIDFDVWNQTRNNLEHQRSSDIKRYHKEHILAILRMQESSFVPMI